jgi:sodium transport system permease protein
MLDKILIVFQKELADTLRDRRSLVSALFNALFTPVLLIGIFVIIGQTFSERAEKPLALPVVGAENAPSLIQFLKQNNAEIQPAPADPEAAVRAGDADVVLIIPEAFADDFSAGRPATVRLVVDDSRQAASVTVRRARDLLASYSNQIGALRLLARGISPSVTDALAVETADVSTPQSQAASFINMTPYILVLVVFTAGLGIVTDTTAGERERGSLEPLLINPVPRRDFVLAKLGATALYTTVMVALTLVALAFMLNVVPLEKYFGARLTVDVSAVLTILLIVLPIVLFASGLQMIIATNSRGFKEAQTTLGLLAILPGLPGLFLAFVPVKSNLWMMLIPTFGQQLLINQVMRGETLSAFHVTVSAVVTLLFGVAFVFAAIRLYQREQVLFGKQS